jgi:hypothetical protein
MSTGRHGRVTLVWRARGTRWVGGWVGPRTGLIAVETRKYSTSGIKPRYPSRPASCLVTVMVEVWFKLVRFRLVHWEKLFGWFLLQSRVKLVGQQTVLSERDQMLLSEAESCLLVGSYVRQQFDEVDDRWEQKKQRNARGVPYNRGTPPSLGRRSALRGASRA